MARFVKVKFLSTKDSQTSMGYFYKEELSRALKKWDTVLVPTRYGLTLAVVVSTYKNEDQVKEAYQSYGTFGLHDIKSVSEKIKSKVVDQQLTKEKAGDIKKKLESKMKEVDEVQKYKMYAELDPSIAELLKELEELRG